MPVLQRTQVPEIAALNKPQFEVGRGQVGEKAWSRLAAHLTVLQKLPLGRRLGLPCYFSPIRGPEGTEYLLHLLAAEAPGR